MRILPINNISFQKRSIKSIKEKGEEEQEKAIEVVKIDLQKLITVPEPEETNTDKL